MQLSIAAFGFRTTRRLPLFAALALAAVLASWAAPATTLAAAPKQLTATLNGAQETPPNASLGHGSAHLTYTDATKILCYAISIDSLGSAEILAHIHGPGLPGVAAGIVYALPLGTPKVGCVGPITAAEKIALLKNELYINVHTVGFPAGELRGQIMRIK